jgi:spore germination cell wall hydrolase CwlJ-like protein
MGFCTKAAFIFAITFTISHDAIAPIPINGMNFLKIVPQTKTIDYDDILWMAINIYYEARNQPQLGKIAVGLVTLNRKKQDNKPTIHAVVTEPRQFSWYNPYIKTAKIRMPTDSDIWRECLRIAEYILRLDDDDAIMLFFEGITHFHTTKVHPPWRKGMIKVVQIEDHIFYRKK